MARITWFVMIIAAVGLATACNRGATPEQPDPVAVEITQTATSPPTVSMPTATPTPTEIPPTATMTPTSPPSTPTPVPTATPHLYVVEKFDTLLGIAIETGTTVRALAAVNGMSEDDFLQIGQELLIPSSDELDATTLVDSDRANSDSQAPTMTADAETSATTVQANSSASPSQSDSASAASLSPDNPPDPQTTNVAPPSEPSPLVSEPTGPPLPAISHPANINPLTGLPIDDPAKLRRRPLLVRIGNDVGARQSQIGLNSADIVYEEITEWWVTRFTAIYLAETPDTIGPVRSARLINVQLVPQYQGALAHSGGSDPVRWEISQAPIANLDEYYNAAPYFYRPGEGWQTRLAIDGQAARDYLAANGLDASVDLHGFGFRDRIDRGEPGESIFIPYPRATSFTEWHYDGASGKYLRWINGAPLLDVGSGQVAADNVVIYFAEHRETDIVEDANGATSIRIIVNGKGPAWFFRDGKLNKGFWQTDGARTPYFGYEDGSPYPLKPGNTWVEVVPAYYTIGLNSAAEASASP